MMKCARCGDQLDPDRFYEALLVCGGCGHHARVGGRDRLRQLADGGVWYELFGQVEADHDPLGFVDTAAYGDRLLATRWRTQIPDAVVCAELSLESRPLLVAAFDFSFMGGSMGVGVGERVALLVEEAAARDVPALLCCASGGARMQEGCLALGQMAKTVVAVERARAAGVPVIVLLADPTFGGVMASFAALGDVILSEPEASLGFAGRRVIVQATHEELPDDFQTAEYFQRRGMIDHVVTRAELRPLLGRLLRAYSGRRGWSLPA